MSSAAPPVSKPGLFPAIARAIDWRLVAAVGLPLWAFLLGVVVTRKPAPAAPPPVEVAQLAGPNGLPDPPVVPAKPQAAEDSIPMPREIVYRTEFQPVPVVVPVPTEPVVVAAPAEFKLPASEVMPADRCQTYDTKIRFHAGLPEAAEEAKQSKKMLLVLHISGNFDDPGFT